MEDFGLLETMFSARALRRFRSDAVPNELISKILEAAIQAPSGGNAQSWLFVVIKDEEQRRKVAAVYAKASKVIRYFYSKRDRPSHMEKQYERLMNSGVYLHEHMSEAPILLLACLKLSSSSNPADVPPDCERVKPEALIVQAERTRCGSIYPAVQNIILACRALGLGTVITTNHLLYEDEIRNVLRLPGNVETYALMPIGFPRDNFGPVRRRPLTEVALARRLGQALAWLVSGRANIDWL
jgi:nitroreductase